MGRALAWSLALWLGAPGAAVAQAVTYRGFVETRAQLFPQDAPDDTTNVVLDLLARQDVFIKPAAWLQFAAGVDARANSHEQVDASWRVDFSDRGTLRPALSVRRLNATLTRGAVTADVGKQFLRWGKTDIVTPTDRFAPRDFLNVFDNEFLAVRGARLVYQNETDAIEGIWVPFFTPSRVPLLDQRWTVPPPGLTFTDAGASIPGGSQFGVRWARTGAGFEHAVSYFDGYNHLPNADIPAAPASFEEGPPLPQAGIPVRRQYPRIRSYGIDFAMPTKWFTAKAESAYFTTSDPQTDEYILYVVQLERQIGEWLLLAGYTGEVITDEQRGIGFAPDRGLSGSLVGRASYTIDTNRSVALESALRQNMDGFYGKAEYSQARGQHWRATATAVLIRGEPDDFIGQYRLNSHLTLGIRYSF